MSQWAMGNTNDTQGNGRGIPTEPSVKHICNMVIMVWNALLQMLNTPNWSYLYISHNFLSILSILRISDNDWHISN